MPRGMGNQDWQWDCTESCTSSVHSELLTAAVTKRSLTDVQIALYLYRTCRNFAKISDYYGKTVLHFAASCGRLELCRWLIVKAGSDVNARDFESGYTPLHMSLFYGQISAAVALINLAADMTVKDHDSFTPLGLSALDQCNKSSPDSPTQVYLYGSNYNYTLGTGTNDPIKLPEVSQHFQNICIKQVCMEEFHSVFVSHSNAVWVCGLGERLGSGKGKTLLVPTKLFAVGDSCEMAAVGQHHTLLLLSNKTVMSCGSNQYHQLGVVPYTESCPTPKPVKLPPSKVIGRLKGIAASKYHSVFYSKRFILVCGLNGGQIGSKVTASSHITVPVELPIIIYPNSKITQVATSSGSVVYALDSGDVYVFHQFSCKKIGRFVDINRIAATGGRLLFNGNEKLGGDLNIMVLLSHGKVHLWNSLNQLLLKLIIRPSFIVKDVFLNEASLLFLTEYGQAFTGVINEREEALTKECKTQEAKTTLKINLESIPNVHRAVSIYSDPKGNNVAIIQIDPHYGSTYSSPQEIKISDQFRLLLEEASVDDDLHDIVFEVGSCQFPAHKFVLASGGLPNRYWRNGTHKVNDVHPVIFKEILVYLYSGSCDLLKTGKCHSRFRNLQTDDPLKLLGEASELFGLKDLIQKLNRLRYLAEEIYAKESQISQEPCKHFFGTDFSELSDVEILTEDKQIITAHKCVLSARLEYFKSMFTRGWSESKSVAQIHMPCSYKIAAYFIDFLYNPELLLVEPDFDTYTNLLKISDQFLVTDLKEKCVEFIINSITLKNYCTILQLASFYHSDRMKSLALEFISTNINAVLESRCLSVLDDSLLSELNSFYREYNFNYPFREITPWIDAPTDEEVFSKIDGLSEIPDVLNLIIPEPKLIKKSSTQKKITPRKSQNSVSTPISSPTESSTLSENINFNTEVLSTGSQSPAEVLFDSYIDVFPALETPPSKTRVGSASIRKYRPVFSINLPSEIKKADVTTAKTLELSNELSGPFRRKMFPPLDIISRKSRKPIETVAAVAKPQFKGWCTPEPVKDVLDLGRKTSKPIDIPCPKLTDIISSEIEMKNNLLKMTSKSFELIQVEDSAIDQLAEFYSVDCSFDERITIRRVTASNIAQPKWLS